MKKIVSLILALLMIAAASAFLGCKDQPAPSAAEDSTVIRIAALKGPTGMGIAPLTDKDTYKQYNVTIESDPSVATSSFIAGEYDVAALPVNVAATLYNKLDKDVVILGVTTLGVLYIVENGSTVNSMADLSGKTLYATGQGSTPEYVLNYLLDKNGVTDVTVEYLSEHSELASRMGAGDVALGMMPEPNVTSSMTKNADLRVALDLTAEWNKVSDAELVQGVLVARRSFVKDHEALVRKLMEDYKAASELIAAGGDEAAQMIVDAGILPAAPVAKSAIPRCNIVFITGDEMAKAVSGMLNVLADANPKSVGGSVPGDDVYFK